MKTISKSRRNFMTTLAVGGAAAVTAVVIKPAVETQAVEDKTKSQGYRLTEHIREYYRSARV